jgi:hypothetical protein
VPPETLTRCKAKWHGPMGSPLMMTFRISAVTLGRPPQYITEPSRMGGREEFCAVLKTLVSTACVKNGQSVETVTQRTEA